MDFTLDKTYYDPEEKVKVRILAPFEFESIDWSKDGKRKDDKETMNVGTVILQIHGGGFISGSSASSAKYTRKIANETGFPVFSVDYRLAPNYKYPDGLSDCW